MKNKNKKDTFLVQKKKTKKVFNPESYQPYFGTIAKLVTAF